MPKVAITTEGLVIIIAIVPTARRRARPRGARIYSAGIRLVPSATARPPEQRVPHRFASVTRVMGHTLIVTGTVLGASKAAAFHRARDGGQKPSMEFAMVPRRRSGLRWILKSSELIKI